MDIPQQPRAELITRKCKIETDNLAGDKPIKLFLTFYAKAVLFIITQYDKLGTFVIPNLSIPQKIDRV